jgi:hypothetical protein
MFKSSHGFAVQAGLTPQRAGWRGSMPRAVGQDAIVKLGADAH